MVVYVVFNSCKTVCDCTDTNTLEVVCIVTGTASVVVFTSCNTVVCDDGKEWSRHVCSKDLFDYVGTFNFDVCKVFDLFCKCIPEFFECFKVFCVTCLETKLFACSHINTVEECEFEDFWNVEVTLKDVSFVTECACFYTTGATAVTSIFDGFACVEQFLDDSFCVVECWLTPTLTSDFTSTFKEFLWVFTGDLNVGVWLNQSHVVHCIKDDVGNFCNTVVTFWCNTTCVDVSKVCVCGRFFKCDTNFWRSWLVVEFNPETFEKFKSLISVEDAVFYVFFIEWSKVLVEVTW